MRSTTVYLVELAESVRETAMRAAREAFPRTQLQLVPVRTVGEALRLPGRGRQLLIVGEASEEDLGVSAQALDATELPRWAVIHFGQPASDVVETVSPEGCTAGVLARVLRLAMLHHELLRDNLRLRGDLKTVARRLSHDLRTPLGCINTVCALLQETGPAATRAPLEAVGTIRGATAEIDTLLEQVGFVLKATSEPLPATTVALGPVVAGVLRRMADRELRGVQVDRPPRWPDVRAVEPWLDFIWQHLIAQAVRQLTLGRTLQLGWEWRGDGFHCWVAGDTAVAVPLQSGLLRPFHLLHQQTSSALDLALVHRLVALQGGRCGYETTPEGRGRFYFVLAGPAGNAGIPPAASTDRGT